MPFKEPTYENVEVGDKLITGIYGKNYSIPIKEVTQRGVITEEYYFSKQASIICHSPYAKSIIVTKENIFLIGKNTTQDVINSIETVSEF